VAIIGDENARCAPAFLSWKGARAMFNRRRLKQQVTLHDRIIEWTKQVRAQAAALPAGLEQDTLLKKVRHAEVAMQLEKWANSPGLQPPE
jgi:hypothetical protein